MECAAVIGEQDTVMDLSPWYAVAMMETDPSMPSNRLLIRYWSPGYGIVLCWNQWDWRMYIGSAYGSYEDTMHETARVGGKLTEQDARALLSTGQAALVEDLPYGN